MKLNGQPERWIVAARLSRVAKQHRDRDDVINGIATQDERAAEWARAEGHEIVHCTKDRGVSGSVPPWERPELGPWLTEPDKIVQYDGIVAYAVDRLSREYYDLTWLRKWAETHHKKLYVIKDRLEWPGRDGTLWGVYGERAHQEKEEIRERIMRQNDALRAAGKLVGRPPFGYVVKGDKYDRRLAPTDAGREYVPLIFEHMIEGWSQDQIAQWLREAGVEPLSGVWWTKTIGTIIRNPVYMGRRCARAFIPPDEVEERDGKPIRYRYGKNWVSYPRWVYGPTIHRCEPLVDADTWRRANDALGNARPKRGRVDVERRAMLSGVLYCPDCGGDSPMYRHHSPSPRKGRDRIPMFYYRCRGRGARHASCGNMVPLGLVDAAADAIIRSRFDTPVMVKKIIPGNEAKIEARLAEIDFDLQQLGSRGLPWDVEDTERIELRAEHGRVKATKIIPDSVESVPMGETYSDLWERTPVNERGPWMARNGFVAYASKTKVTVKHAATGIEATADL